MKFCSAICALVMSFALAQAEELTPVGMDFYLPEEENIAWQDGVVLDYADEILTLENQKLDLPAEILLPELAEEILHSGQKIQFTQENDKIVKLNLLDEKKPENQPHNSQIGVVVAGLTVLCILGIWRKFYLRARS